MEDQDHGGRRRDGEERSRGRGGQGRGSQGRWGRPAAVPRLRKLTQRGFVKFAVPPPGSPLEELLATPPSRLAEPPSSWLEELRAIESRLAAAKSAMDPHESDPDLREVLRAVDLYAPLKATVRRHFNGQVVTNAWLKMYEVAAQLGLPEAIATTGADGALTLRAFCNAELPGAFVCALNHYMVTRLRGSCFEWVASSLYPEEGNTASREGDGGGGDILGDYYGLYACNPSRWLMSPEMRGDVTACGDLAALAAGARARLGGGADLYTSDAGIGVAEDYNNQEQLTARINLGQIVVGLLTLRVGGALVTKTYTFTHPYSVAVAGVCAALFDTFYIAKPETSRPTNSEVYFVGVGYRGASMRVLRALTAAVADFDLGRPVVPIGGEAFAATRDAIILAARQIHLRQQVAFVEEAMEFFDQYRGRVQELRRGLEKTARQVQYEWLSANPIERINTAAHIPSYGLGTTACH